MTYSLTTPSLSRPNASLSAGRLDLLLEVSSDDLRDGHAPRIYHVKWE
jgi:hypothetical protein